MKTTALRLYGKKDLRLESFELPALNETEILADITSNSICMSSYKAAVQGPDHKRVPSDAADNPVIVGHEFCGSILEIGARVKTEFKKGDKYSIQPAFHIPGRELEAPGYSFQYIGGDMPLKSSFPPKQWKWAAFSLTAVKDSSKPLFQNQSHAL